MSVSREYAGKPPPERRRERRVPLSVAVQLSRWEDGGSGGAVSRVTARSIDISAGGVLISLSQGGVFVPGELVNVSLTVPSEARGIIPFSLITGVSRVVRVCGRDGQEHVALAFCEPNRTMLGSIVHP